MKKKAIFVRPATLGRRRGNRKVEVPFFLLNVYGVVGVVGRLSVLLQRRGSNGDDDEQSRWDENFYIDCLWMGGRYLQSKLLSLLVALSMLHGTPTLRTNRDCALVSLFLEN